MAKSGFESRHPSKIINGRHKRRSGRHTLARQKNIQKKDIFSLQTAEAEPQFSRRFVEAAPDSVQPPHLPPQARYASRKIREKYCIGYVMFVGTYGYLCSESWCFVLEFFKAAFSPTLLCLFFLKEGSLQ